MAPAEVENFLCRYPGVAAAQVVGLKDRRGCDVIVAPLPPQEGLGLAIADRLRRAAGP